MTLQASVAVGGHGGGGGQGGSVTVNNTDGGMFTRGSNSFGVFAESVGGGGGDGNGTLANAAAVARRISMSPSAAMAG